MAIQKSIFGGQEKATERPVFQRMQEKECSVAIREGRGISALNGDLKVVAKEISKQDCKLRVSDTLFQNALDLQLNEDETRTVKLAGRAYVLRCEALYFDATESAWCVRLATKPAGRSTSS